MSKNAQNVQDVNDNPHQFTQLHYNAAVNEGALPSKNVHKYFEMFKKCPKTSSLSRTKMPLSMREHCQLCTYSQK